MKLFLSLLFITASAFAASAEQPSPHAPNHPIAKSGNAKPSTRVPTAVVIQKPVPLPVPGGTSAAAAQPATKPVPAGSVTLDAYISALASDVPLSKDEQTDVKTYYLDEGAKLQAILNDASLSPLEQTQHVDFLRDALNLHVAALLGDPDRAAQFARLERSYRVSLIDLAAQGGLVPTSTPPQVPEPTATTPAQAEKPTPGIPRQDAVPGT
jgi:hypothetical protein